MENSTADFEYAANITAGIIVNIFSILPQEKQSGNENNKKEYCKVNIYLKNEANKSKDEKRANKIKLWENKGNHKQTH